MNPIAKIISKIIIQINSIIEKLDKRTIESIKQSFYFLTAISVITAIILGYNFGGKSAKRSGKILAEFTNDAFTIDIKRERKEGKFHSMLDMEIVREIDRSDFNKLKFLSRDILEPEVKEKIVEPELSRKKTTASREIDMDRIAEIDRTDEIRTSSKVKEIKRRESVFKERNLDIIKEEPDRTINRKDKNTRTQKPEKEIIKESKILKKQKRLKSDELSPLEKKPGIIE